LQVEEYERGGREQQPTIFEFSRRQLKDPPLPGEVSNELQTNPPKEEDHPKETTAQEKEEYLLKVTKFGLSFPLASSSSPQNLVRIDPYIAQKEWAAGTLPDPGDHERTLQMLTF
jgi:hypothetical protein